MRPPPRSSWGRPLLLGWILGVFTPSNSLLLGRHSVGLSLHSGGCGATHGARGHGDWEPEEEEDVGRWMEHPLLQKTRRELLVMMGGTALLVGEGGLPASAASSSVPVFPGGIVTVVLEAPSQKLGVRLEDRLMADGRILPVVQSVVAGSPAEAAGVVSGMIVLGRPSSASVVSRIQTGPYPLALQFYDLSSAEVGALPPSSDDLVSSSSSSSSLGKALPKVSSKGAGLGVTTTRKASTKDCVLQARRGDTVVIEYEARVASPGGPIYDSSAGRGGPVSFVLGDGRAIAGVDAGIGGMCEGEIRELDIPSALGYGRFGSDIFDIPGGVRLWWKVELVGLTEGEKRFPFR